MKKILLALLLMSVMMVPKIQAETIGYIDMEVILRNYNDAQPLREELDELKKKFEEVLIEREKEIAKAIEKGKKSEKIEDMKTKLKEELLPRRNEIAQKEYEFQRNLIGKVTTDEQNVVVGIGRT